MAGKAWCLWDESFLVCKIISFLLTYRTASKTRNVNGIVTLRIWSGKNIFFFVIWLSDKSVGLTSEKEHLARSSGGGELSRIAAGGAKEILGFPNCYILALIYSCLWGWSIVALPVEWLRFHDTISFFYVVYYNFKDKNLFLVMKTLKSDKAHSWICCICCLLSFGDYFCRFRYIDRKTWALLVSLLWL